MYYKVVKEYLGRSLFNTNRKAVLPDYKLRPKTRKGRGTRTGAGRWFSVALVSGLEAPLRALSGSARINHGS